MIKFDAADPTVFEARLLAMLEAAALVEEIDRIDDWVHSCMAEGKEDFALRCAEISVELLQSRERHWPTAYALNTLVCIYAMRKDGVKAKVTLERLIDHSIEHDTPQAGFSGIQNVSGRLGELGRVEYALDLMAKAIKFYAHFKMTREAIDTVLGIAMLLTDFGAFQPAYHALYDAECLAREHGDAILLARVLSGEAAVALIEGDHGFGSKVAGLALELYEQNEVDPPPTLILNQATNAMQCGELAKAFAAYSEYESRQTSGSDPHLLAVKINKSACLRRMGDFVSADEQIETARDLASSEVGLDPELLIELELVAAANAEAGKSYERVASCLKRAVTALDFALSATNKLHFRRALRERYVDRIEVLLCSLPKRGPANDCVEIIACTRGNQLQDWLHLLDWVERISAVVTDEERARLNGCVQRLANFGAPYLHGYREKYDDPLAGGLMPDPWRDFDALAAELTDRYQTEQPLAAASATHAADLIRHRLDEGFSVLINLSTAGGHALHLLRGQYCIYRHPVEQAASFGLAIHRRRDQTISAAAFNECILSYRDAILEFFDDMLQSMCRDDIKGLLFFPDRLDILPINLLVLSYAPLRQRMAVGDFEVRTCLALFPRTVESRAMTTALALIEASSDLQLAETQARSFSAVLDTECRIIESASSSDVGHLVNETDILIVAQHGVPIGVFADPNFANMEGLHKRGTIYFDIIQETAYNSKYRLAMLSACHSGTFVSRNAQRDFRSHELIGYPSVLLTNRKSVVSGAAWATLDRFEYLLSIQFALEIEAGNDLARAFSKAIASIVDGSAETVIGLFDHIQDSELRAKMNPLSGAELPRIENLKAQPFCYGAYQLYTLV